MGLFNLFFNSRFFLLGNCLLCSRLLSRSLLLFGSFKLDAKQNSKFHRFLQKISARINELLEILLRNLRRFAAKLTGNEVVLDAYCGIGTIGLTAADKAKQVVGVELNRDAVHDAISNAKHNGVKNARFFAADATEWISAAAAAGERADVIFMDPPREGSTPQFIESVARMAPKRVVYVSCNPETMARDLALLTKKGYRAEGFTPVDMFPNSEHIEVVCALSRQEQWKQSRR